MTSYFVEIADIPFKIDCGQSSRIKTAEAC